MYVILYTKTRKCTYTFAVLYLCYVYIYSQELWKISLDFVLSISGLSKYGQGDPYNIVLLKLLSTKVLGIGLIKYYIYLGSYSYWVS